LSDVSVGSSSENGFPDLRIIRTETDMETLFFLGQVLSLVALAWGAVLCLTSTDEDVKTLFDDRMPATRNVAQMGNESGGNPAR
jgi:hypothetical protein